MGDFESTLAKMEPRITWWAADHYRARQEDTAQEGRLGAWLAYKTWRPGLADAYAWCWIRAHGAMQDFIRTDLGLRRPPVIVTTLDVAPADVLAVTERGYDATEAAIDLDAIRGQSTPEQQEVIDLTLVGLNLREVGLIRGHGEARTCQILGDVRRRVANTSHDE